MTYSRGGAENEGQNCTSHYNTAEIYSPKTDFQFTFGEFILAERTGENSNKKSPAQKKISNLPEIPRLG